MYKLPNNIKIDEEAVKNAMLDYQVDDFYYLDYETGKVISGRQIVDDGVESEENRYYEIIKLSDEHVISWMEWLTRELIADEDLEFAKSLLVILKKPEPIKNFLVAIEGNWSYGWPQCENDFCYEEMEKWFDTLPFEVEDDWQDFFAENCDCPICQAMAQGHTDEKLLKDAFRETKFKQVMGGIVGEKE